MRFDTTGKNLLRKSTIRRRSRVLKVSSRFSLLSRAFKNDYTDREHITEEVVNTYKEKTMKFEVSHNDEFYDEYDVKRLSSEINDGD